MRHAKGMNPIHIMGPTRLGKPEEAGPDPRGPFPFCPSPFVSTLFQMSCSARKGAYPFHTHPLPVMRFIKLPSPLGLALEDTRADPAGGKGGGGGAVYFYAKNVGV